MSRCSHRLMLHCVRVFIENVTTTHTCSFIRCLSLSACAFAWKSIGRLRPNKLDWIVCRLYACVGLLHITRLRCIIIRVLRMHLTHPFPQRYGNVYVKALQFAIITVSTKHSLEVLCAQHKASSLQEGHSWSRQHKKTTTAHQCVSASPLSAPFPMVICVLLVSARSDQSATRVAHCTPL